MSGVSSDLAHATQTAYNMLTIWGMDGSLFSILPWGMGQLDPETKTRVEQVLEQEFKKAKALLVKYAGAMHEIAEQLLKSHELDGQDVIEIIAKHDDLIAHGRGPRILPDYVLVGAGGIGYYITLYIRGFQYDKVAALCLIIFAMVLAVDLIAFLLRKRVG